MEKTIESLCRWFQRAVCDKVRYLSPPPDERVDGKAALVHPKATPFVFAPVNGDGESNCPALVVQVMEVAENGGVDEMRIKLQFCVWNPGLLKGEMYEPQGDKSFVRVDGAHARGYDGWMDLWNFMGRAVREMHGAADLGGLVLDRDKGIRYGPASEDGLLLDTYPYWYGWAEFYAHRTTAPDNTAYL